MTHIILVFIYLLFEKRTILSLLIWKYYYPHIFGQWHSPGRSMGKHILSTENYEMPTDNEQSIVALLVALFCMQKTHNFSKTGDQGQEKLEKYNSANRPGRGWDWIQGAWSSSQTHQLLVQRGWTYKRWELIGGKPNSNKFQERNSHCPSESTSQTALAASGFLLSFLHKYLHSRE